MGAESGMVAGPQAKKPPITLVEYIRGNTNNPKLTITPMTVIAKENVSAATPWEPTAASLLKRGDTQSAPGFPHEDARRSS